MRGFQISGRVSKLGLQPRLGLQKRVQVSNEGIDTGGLGFQMEVLDMDWRFKQRCQIKVATKGGIRFQIWVLRFQINVAI